MKKLFIGIDVSKDVFDFYGISDQGEVLIPSEVSFNTRSGIKSFISKVKKHSGYDPHICFEHTGHYGYLLMAELNSAKFKFSVINPLEIKRSNGLARGKTDAVDAVRIAKYALANRFDLKPFTLAEREIRTLRALMTMREGYVKIVVQLKNSLKAFKVIKDLVPLSSQLKAHQKLIDAQQDRIASLEKQMQEIVAGNVQLSTSYRKITKVIGVGPLTAIKCIVETENFSKFDDPRKFSCHSGLAPFEYQSGSSVRKRTKTSPIRDKNLKAILFKAASSAIQHDPQLRSYYRRKTEEGKHKLSVLNAVANKIILRIFAVVNREEPFVKLVA